MHGYEMLQELAERTQGLWRPSPGSLYPALQLLEDQELVVSVTADGRRRSNNFSLLQFYNDDSGDCINRLPRRMRIDRVAGSRPDKLPIRLGR